MAENFGVDFGLVGLAFSWFDGAVTENPLLRHSEVYTPFRSSKTEHVIFNGD